MTVFEAYITNLGKYAEGQLVGETLKFPATTEEVQSLLKNIGVDGVRYEEFFITAFDGDVMGLYDYLTEYENLDELNHLAHLISELDSDEIETLEAALNKGDHTSSVADIINLVHNLDCYELHPGVTDDETLGRIYVEDMELLDAPDNVLPYGKALCPFHNDRNPSLYVADDHYYCFACGEHGDVIDFVGKLFQLSPYDAARKLMADFHLSPDKPPSAAALHAKRIRTEAQQLMENERLCFSVLSDYARVLRDWKVRYAPQSPDAPVHARFMEACHKLDETEYYLDILCVGDSHERAKVVQQQMADGKLDRLRRRLEKIHKEELEDGYDTAGVA